MFRNLPVGACSYGPLNVHRLAVYAQNQDRKVWITDSDILYETEAILFAERDIKNDNMRGTSLNRVKGLQCVLGLSADYKVCFLANPKL